MREGGRQVGRHDAGDQECRPDEAEAVQDEQRPQGFGEWPEADFWPDVSGGNDPPSDEAEYDAREKAELWQHERLLAVWYPLVPMVALVWYYTVPMSRETMMMT